jgi:hypothetical protein
VKRSTIPRPTETAALANVAPRLLPLIASLLWELAGAELRRDAEGRYLLGHLVIRASRTEAE